MIIVWANPHDDTALEELLTKMPPKAWLVFNSPEWWAVLFYEENYPIDFDILDEHTEDNWIQQSRYIKVDAKWLTDNIKQGKTGNMDGNWREYVCQCE